MSGVPLFTISGLYSAVINDNSFTKPYGGNWGLDGCMRVTPCEFFGCAGKSTTPHRPSAQDNPRKPVSTISPDTQHNVALRGVRYCPYLKFANDKKPRYASYYNRPVGAVRYLLYANHGKRPESARGRKLPITLHPVDFATRVKIGHRRLQYYRRLVFPERWR